MNLLIINGPNLNLLGSREPRIYGSTSLVDLEESMARKYKNANIDWLQSNHEGELIDTLQAAVGKYNGVVLNPGAYGHTSLALADCLAAIEISVVEVHISHVFGREVERHKVVCAPFVKAFISGFGVKGYELAIDFLIDNE